LLRVFASMYTAGQDIGAVVGDLGSVCTKIGYAGEDFPR
jgi:Actin